MKWDNQKDLKEFLDQKADTYNSTRFIDSDPISIPHRFSKSEDIEIAGFIASTLSWGRRETIIKNTQKFLDNMDHDPHDFILHFSKKDLKPFTSFVHRTFNGEDSICFLYALRKIYVEEKSLQNLFRKFVTNKSLTDFSSAIEGWRNFFFSVPHPKRSQKHFASPLNNSAAKRINMFLRWMIRKDTNGVDFGIWDLPPSLLTMPLDVHSARVARSLHLLKRKQNDWKAATELTTMLKSFDPSDPVKYDFALFGLGVFEKF